MVVWPLDKNGWTKKIEQSKNRIKVFALMRFLDWGVILFGKGAKARCEKPLPWGNAKRRALCLRFYNKGLEISFINRSMVTLPYAPHPACAVGDTEDAGDFDGLGSYPPKGRGCSQ